MTSDKRGELAFSYWSDPMCIWAYVAQPKLDRLLSETDGRLDIEYRVVPVFGSVPHRFQHGPWSKAGPEGRAKATRDIAVENHCDEVTGDCWRNDMPSSSWSPGAAIKAVAGCEHAGQVPPGTLGAYLRNLRAAFFVENQNIARRGVQLAVAEALLIPRAPVEQRLDDGSALAALWEDHQEKEQQRIQGSPTYVFDGGRAMLYGNFAFGILKSTVDELLRGARALGSAC